jgi:glucokinase
MGFASHDINENAIIQEVRMGAEADSFVLVYDVGGSHISAATCRQCDYQLGTTVTKSHHAEQSSDAFADLLFTLGTEASQGRQGIVGASLAFPGPFDYAAGISRMTHKLPYLFGFDLRHALAQRFGWQDSQVRFLNDADAFLLGEIGAGAANGFDRAVGITLGTGVGSAFAVGGKVVTEGPGVPPGGEIWDLPYECGILEDAISTRALQANYQRRTGIHCEVAQMAAAANDNPAAEEVFAHFGQHLGRTLRQILTAFRPNVIVIGGGISRSAQLFLPAAQAELQDANIPLRISTLLDNAALAGAGVHFFNSEAPAARPALSGVRVKA